MASAQKTQFGVIILAAGQGKRMNSPLPKVLHEVSGSPLVFHILRAVQQSVAGVSIAIVVGHQRELVEDAIRSRKEFSDLSIEFIHQAEQLGTGHAARQAIESAWGKKMIDLQAQILVLPGDLPLITSELVGQLLRPLVHTETLRLLTCRFKDPTGYGRVIRRGTRGGVLRIVEEKDANEKQKLIQEVACSIYLFRSSFLHYGLQKLSRKNAQKEYYLTDLVAQAAMGSKKTDVLLWHSSADLRGVNDTWELAQANRAFNERCLKNWSLRGVTFLDPQSAWVESTVLLDSGVKIHPNVQLEGQTRVGSGACIRSGVVLRNVEVGEKTEILSGTIAQDSKIGAHCQIGPYAHLRPGSQVGNHCKVGNFVELKKTRLGDQTSVAHLSYLGDAEVGARVNIGCGFVTCNYDGRVVNGQRKHPTRIEDDAFVGSDCQTIAPVVIGRGAYVASGSTVTENVEPGSLAIARSRQVNKTGYAKKIRGS